MTNGEIAEMTEEECKTYQLKYPSLRGRETLWKIWFKDGGWHYGLLSKEQAEWALESQEGKRIYDY